MNPNQLISQRPDDLDNTVLSRFSMVRVNCFNLKLIRPGTID